MIRLVAFVVLFLVNFSVFAELTIQGSDINTPDKAIELFSQQLQEDNFNFYGFVRQKFL